MAEVVQMKGKDVEDPRVSELNRRIQRATLDKNRHIANIEDCYKFALPWRHKLNQTVATPDLEVIYDETIAMVLEDFAADMLSTFTPMKMEWLTVKPTETLDAADTRSIQGPLAKYTKVIFAEMARSNLYQAMQEAYLDLGPGTMAVIIKDDDPAQPIHCQAVPATELLIDRGPCGDVGGRWRTWKCRAEDIAVLWPEAKHPSPNGTWKQGDLTEYDVIDGVWRDFSKRDTETWIYVVMVNSTICYQEIYRGVGSCPFVVARWSRDSTTAWGIGPTYRTLPAIRTLNHVKKISLKNYDKQADPVVSYEDDSVVNLDQGVTPGMWVPRAVGSKAPEVVESNMRLDMTVFQLDELRSAVRRAHYQDRPDQLGKTPPTATQWADEAADRQRRMGTPATNLVIEWQYPIFYRFAYLLAKRGVLPPLSLNGKSISVEPISPLLRAQEQEEVVRMDRFAEMIAARFGPQMANIIIKGFDYAHVLADKMGVNPNLVRTDKEIAQAIQQMAPLLQGQGGGDQGAPPQQGAPPSA